MNSVKASHPISLKSFLILFSHLRLITGDSAPYVCKKVMLKIYFHSGVGIFSPPMRITVVVDYVMSESRFIGDQI
jgi:hypothetical protein